jgi:hypothetical protein
VTSFYDNSYQAVIVDFIDTLPEQHFSPQERYMLQFLALEADPVLLSSFSLYLEQEVRGGIFST